MDVQSGEPDWQAGAFFTQAGEELACNLCPHRCVLAEGETGYCRVRRNRLGRMETATMAAAVRHLDAIERKPFYHYYPGSKVLTTAAPGCTMRCRYCLNFRLSQFGRSGGNPWQAELQTPQQLVALAAGAALGFSYSEPGLAAELTLALAALEPKPRLVWKTNGFLTPELVAALAPHLDAVNIDLKCADEAAHQRLTGAALAPIFAAVEAFLEAGVWVELSTPLIPGFSASEAALLSLARRIAAWGRHIPWHLLRFTPDYQMRDLAPTHPDALANARELALGQGLNYVYVERALGESGRSTHCRVCDALVLRRGLNDGTVAGSLEGRCPNCGLVCEGRWNQGGVL